MSASVQEEQIGGVIKQVKLDTSRRYEAKISKIEGRLHELVAHNQALTSELSKWTVDDSMFEDDSTFEDPDGDDMGAEASSPQSGGEGRGGGGRKGNQNSRRDQYDYYKGLPSMSESNDVERSLLHLEEELGHDLNDADHHSRPQRRKQRSNNNNGANSDFGSAISSTSKARARIQQVRDSLELVASKPILHASRPGVAKNKATASQQNQQMKQRRKNGRRKKTSSAGIHRSVLSSR
jgi:hypothetical protein